MLRTERSAVGGRLSLKEWVKGSLLPTGAKVLLRCRGNILHILCEGETCPNEAIASYSLSLALREKHPNMLLPANSSPIYQVFLYGRALGQKRPNWTVRLDPNDFLSIPNPGGKGEERSGKEREVEAPYISPFLPVPQSPSSKSDLQSLGLLERASRGNAQAIARYLSNVLSPYGVGVKVFVKDVAGKSGGELCEGEANVAPSGKRLWVLCQCSYSPDPVLLAEPVAQQLRKLMLPIAFRDAAIVGCVTGEKKPEWICGVDLTPRERILEEWSRWGDVGALAKLLNRRLAALDIETTAVLKESTVHLFFSHKDGGEWKVGEGNSLGGLRRPEESPKDALRAIVKPIIEAVAPQGIFGATLYGQLSGAEAPPSWVDWLDLPASYQANLAPSAIELARIGNEGALKFLLERLLNPDIDRKLLTGGYNVTIRRKADLLHIMVDGALSVAQKQIGPQLVEFIANLNIPGIAGVRAYGRSVARDSSSTKWRVSVDFQPRQSAKSQTAPELTAREAAREGGVGSPNIPPIPPTPPTIPYPTPATSEMVAEEAGPASGLVFSPDLKSDELQACLTLQPIKFLPDSARDADSQSPKRIKQLLIWSGLFTSEPSPTPYTPHSPRGWLLTIWGLLGLLLALQTDWFVGELIRSMPQKRTASEFQGVIVGTRKEFSALVVDLEGSEEAGIGMRGEIKDGSLWGDNTEEAISASNATSAKLALEAQTAGKANSQNSLPSFNSEQLDRQIAEYFQYIATVGKPDVLILGSSRALRGIDPLVLQSSLAESYPELRIFNFGVNGATARVVDWIVRELIHPNHLPELIVWADGARAFNSGRADRTMARVRDSVGYELARTGELRAYVAPEELEEDLAEESSDIAPAAREGFDIGRSYRQLDDWLYRLLAAASPSLGNRDRAIGFLTEGVRAFSDNPTGTPAESGVATDSTEPETPASDRRHAKTITQLNGFLPFKSQFNPSTYYRQYARVSGSFDADYASFSLAGEQTRALNNLLQFIDKSQISLVFVNMPLTEKYLDPVRTKFELQFREYMLQKASQNRFTFKDLSDLWPRQYSFFSDPSHLNVYGAKEVSVLLASDRAVRWPASKRTGQQQ